MFFLLVQYLKVFRNPIKGNIKGVNIILKVYLSILMLLK